jgi:AbiV family abortive infection protein
MNDPLNTTNNVRHECLANAEALLSVAERELGKGADHISFHLGILALEEIGKAVISGIKFATSTFEDEERGPGGEDDHVRKLFWAIWGVSLRVGTFTSAEIESNQKLATSLHRRRIASLYTDSTNPIPLGERVSPDDAKNLLSLTRSRLEIEKDISIKEDQDPESNEALKWFFKVSKDQEKRAELFSIESRNKMAELQDGVKWLVWLRERDNKQREEMRAFAEKELRRERPSEKEKFVPKYKIRIRLQSTSHTIKDDAFVKWNTGVNDIKIFKVGKKQLSGFARSEIYVDFLIPKAIPVQGVWDHGMFMSRIFIVALNVATKGFFWWKVQRDPEKYYEEMVDLEADKNGRIGLHIAIGKRLTINWDEAKLKLDQKGMVGVEVVLGFMFKRFKVLEDFIKHYTLGLALFSKTDIHLRMETNSFIEIFNALKCAMLALGDWDGKSNFRETVIAKFASLEGITELEQTIDLGIKAEKAGATLPEITLTEVMAIKLYCDIYLILKVNDFFEHYKKQVATPPGNNS